jgi:hypothetical protein
MLLDVVQSLTNTLRAIGMGMLHHDHQESILDYPYDSWYHWIIQFQLPASGQRHFDGILYTITSTFPV